MSTKSRTIKDNILIGREIKRLRLLSSTKQREIAAILDISITQVQKYEAGIDRIPLRNLLTVAKFFNKDLLHFQKIIDESPNALPIPDCESQECLTILENFMLIKNKDCRQKIAKFVQSLVGVV